MNKSLSLTLTMDSPCSENWNEMEPTEQGRYCNKCQKPVVNFVEFTDQQLLQYFIEHPYPACGRLLPSQVDKVYTEATTKTNRTMAPVAAALLTFAAVTTEAADATPAPLRTQAFQLPGNVKDTTIIGDTIVISGRVWKSDGPVANAEVVLGEQKVVSDKDGKFQFTLYGDAIKPMTIGASYGHLKNALSFHPLMGSAWYDITLDDSYTIPYTGGFMPAFHVEIPVWLSSLHFQTFTRLTAKDKAFLRRLGTHLKNNPNGTVVIKSYYRKNKKQAVKLAALIKDYLIDKEGISEKRFRLAEPALLQQKKAEVIIEFGGEDGYTF